MNTGETPLDIISVLIIEDDPGQARLMERTLKRAGIRVECALDGEVGLAKVSERRFDVALIDHALPGRSGLEVLAALVDHPSGVVPMMVTGSGSEALAAEALDKGAAAYIIKDVDGRYRALMASTVRRVLEQRRESRARRLAESHLGAALADLDAQNKALREFTHLMAHDLKAPARQVHKLAEWALSDYGEQVPEELRELLQRIEERGRTLMTFIDDSLTLVSSASKQVTFEETPLEALFLEAMVRIWPSLEEARGEVTLGELPVVRVDAVQMAHVVQNLLENAAKYHKPREKPAIRVSSWEEDRWICFAVEDDGVGFPQEDAESLFTPFKRHASGVRLYRGSGLGLSICRQIVERHHGEISAEAQVGEGARFTVKLPKGS